MYEDGTRNWLISISLDLLMMVFLRQFLFLYIFGNLFTINLVGMIDYRGCQEQLPLCCLCMGLTTVVDMMLYEIFIPKINLGGKGE